LVSQFAQSNQSSLLDPVHFPATSVGAEIANVMHSPYYSYANGTAS
jgi:hypothetical protein